MSAFQNAIFRTKPLCTFKNFSGTLPPASESKVVTEVNGKEHKLSLRPHCTLLKSLHLCSCQIHSSKEKLLNVLGFLNVASVVQITSTALFIYSNCAGMFLLKLKRQTLDLPLYRKKLVPRRFSYKYIRIFSASSTRSNVSSLFGIIPTLLTAGTPQTFSSKYSFQES